MFDLLSGANLEDHRLCKALRARNQNLTPSVLARVSEKPSDPLLPLRRGEFDNRRAKVGGGVMCRRPDGRLMTIGGERAASRYTQQSEVAMEAININVIIGRCCDEFQKFDFPLITFSKSSDRR